MNINKVVFGGETVVDLTEDTVTPETLAEGYTAHDATGKQIVGTMKVVPPLPYVMDGLVACYDGIWNAGVSQHDETAVIWKDISGNHHEGIIANAPAGDTSGWQTNHYLFDQTETCFNLSGDFALLPGSYTVQMVMEPLRAGYSAVLTSQTDALAAIAIQNTGIAVWHFPENGQGGVLYDTVSPFYTWLEGKKEDGQNQKYTYNYAQGKTNPYFGATVGGAPSKMRIGGTCAYAGNTGAKMKLYAIRFYNRVLSNEEINLNWQLDKARFGL